MYSTLITVALVILSAGCTVNTAHNDITNDRNGNLQSDVELTGPPAEAGGESQAARAEAVVADLYKQHDAKKSPFFQTKNRALVDKYFTKQLADLIWKDAVTSEGEVGALDADPLYDAQDVEIKDFKIGAADIKGERATVPVTFTNFREKKSLTFSLSLVNDSWKIADVNYGRKDTLISWLRSAPPTTTDDTLGEFEGKYIVGDTSCTVEFKNKGYAVRWAKGSGIEYFAFAEGTTFASSLDADAANKFVFDDENYNTGTFYRADGKTFPVRRSK